MLLAEKWGQNGLTSLVCYQQKDISQVLTNKFSNYEKDLQRKQNVDKMFCHWVFLSYLCGVKHSSVDVLY
jgi:hypothetical protein